MSGYDANLLKDAPEASASERREGYNIDLLERPISAPTPRAPSAPPADAEPSFPPTAAEAGATNGPGGNEYSSVSQEEKGTPHDEDKSIPFWTTTKGKLIIALIAAIVIGAVVGGAVGGTSRKSSSKVGITGSHTPTTSVLSTSQTTSVGEGGSGPSTGGAGGSATAATSTTSHSNNAATSLPTSLPSAATTRHNGSGGNALRRRPSPAGGAAGVEADV